MPQRMETIVLGSRSPRRRELLAELVPSEAIEILPPIHSAEAGFEGLRTWSAIIERAATIARDKALDVRGQLEHRARTRGDSWVPYLLTADTTVVVTEPDGDCLALGQPPDAASWKETVCDWFTRYYAGRTHRVVTAVCGIATDGVCDERQVESRVTMRDDIASLARWYVETGEPQGKAGGYAIQGLGSLFVTRIEGSLTNIIGLPLETIRDMLGVV